MKTETFKNLTRLWNRKTDIVGEKGSSKNMRDAETKLRSHTTHDVRKARGAALNKESKNKGRCVVHTGHAIPR